MLKLSMSNIIIDNDLRLRPIDLEQDLENALRWYSDPEVLYFSEASDVPFDKTLTMGMYNYFLKRGEVYIIEVLRGGNWFQVGDAVITQDSIPIVIGEKEFRGKGFGKRVLRMMVNRAKEIGYEKMTVSGIYTYNHRSRHIYETAGFKVVDTKLDDEGREVWIMTFEINKRTGQ
ncbi:MAG: hypothetical protein A2504_16490 [Bdellovibrionales bacterium RIFOXYD12_FULL_39_22]|nr:MAG: hypothetical protein A2385_13755 [Bdellovibrionales bacterium RIFOXYB1_FULL_39_21]OFZ47188.1 MAG: hypothetical protein A2404_02205 [Bdellovibrionales bacterium RIFOXYC1_FULL_39_130]OFZ75027.1 MAG: hypothetical protein A2560_07815 [Bdellovibrionales bacterium RIFOXYD1_FULL_39_84]OFZ94711.1 MAG: hypothetical protein A2504_16490 [Bdellovibrionales bacterium RIFOXYD12_FULL_39_22]